jgi:ADP-dependent phosphofructokinase/glucokinase
MKKHIILFFAMLACMSLSYAQQGSERREERIKAFRVAIFTEKLNLTSEEAQTFWPVYNEFIDRRDALMEQFKPAKRIDDMSDSELEAQIARHFERQQKELDLEREMVAKLRKTMPLRKVARVPNAEREFREALFKKLQERRAERQGGRD